MKRFVSSVIWLTGVLLGLIGAVISFFVASFMISNIPVVCVLSLMVGFLIIFGMGKLAQRVSPRRGNGKKPVLVAGVAMVALFSLSAVTVFKPLPGPMMAAEVPENTKYWDLKTGSHIAYWHYEAVGSNKSTPIIFLHGGPGAFTRDLERDFFSKFTELGYDVYLYDQPGAGFSSTLPLENYTLKHYVQDLEAIRQEIGAEKFILIGQSFGGVLGTVYASEYPERLEKIIFTSPGELKEEKSAESTEVAPNASDSMNKFEPSFSEGLRFNAAVIMAQINYRNAEAFATQKELTDYATRMISGFMAQSYPPDYAGKVPNLKTGGINIYANTLLQNDKINQIPIATEKIKKLDVPLLILRTEYDYIPWSDTRYYREIYANSHLVYIKDSGHIPWAVNAQESYDTISAFITDQPLPLPDYTGSEDPAK